MRSKPGRGELRIQRALGAFVSALQGSQIPWMVIGGIAIIARGVRRMTADIDAVVQGDRTDVPSLLSRGGAASMAAQGRGPGQPLARGQNA